MVYSDVLMQMDHSAEYFREYTRYVTYDSLKILLFGVAVIIGYCDAVREWQKCLNKRFVTTSGHFLTNVMLKLLQ